MSDRKLQWHPGFQAALQIELSDEKAGLEFHKEYNLSEKPLQIDTIVLKQNAKKMVNKSIGRLFRTHNVIEYKSPADYLGINGFYKGIGYACLYQALTPKEQEHLPHVKIEYVEEGIYYVEGLLFPVQIILLHKLLPEDYIWLSRLRANLDVKKDIELLGEAYKGKENIRAMKQ